ncbi:hypothetical protein CVT24_000673 [Panaeolus cyanescens]|uniref:Spt20-like SEP domain-containing protein n=1 Tax=Panaeolus cyanescens TaxID=181874 RepID=A0A409VWM8_9AGAR|nr:hypothetical protein CVT24_000673 [Panaeolus cyanescens]
MSGYNRTRYVEQLLEKTESSPPSFTVHLYPEYWVLNNGSKFLYHNQIASLLDDIRAHRIPVDFLHLFDQARVPFYEGCMIVELLDYRPQRSKEPALKNPEKTRVILHPNAETLYEDICTMNAQHGSKWTDRDALEIEAKLLLVTSQPLCLDPDPHLTRIVNHVIRVSTPSMPMSLKRKASIMEPEDDGPEKAKRDRLMGFMAPRGLKPHPEYKLLDAMHKGRVAKAAEASAPPSNSQFSLPHQSTPSQHIPPSQDTPASHTPAPLISSAPSPAESVDKKGSKIKKGETPQMPFNVAFTRSNGSQTPVPVPPQPTQHQFINQNPPTPSSNPMMQPQTYPSVQAAQAASRVQATGQAPQHYIPQFQIPNVPQMQAQAQQQQQAQQPPTPNQLQPPRPPSQPVNPTPPATTPASHAPAPPGQSPKPTVQSIQPSPTPQPGAQPYSTTPTFQAATPHQPFVQQPPMRRPPTAMGTPAQTHAQLPMSPNTNPGQVQGYNSQMQVNQQMQAQQQQQQQLIQQRMALANMQKNGRMTPQVSQGGGVMQTPTMASATVTPSPVRNSPILVNQQQGAVNRGSPMPAKAQIPIQNQGGAQQAIQPGQPQQQVQQNAQQLRMFPAQYPSNLRPHPTQAQVIAQATSGGTPANMAGSPMMNARPITPAVAVGPDGKPIAMGRRTPMPGQAQQQQQQQMQGVNAGSPRSQTPSVIQHSSPAQAHALLQQQAQMAVLQQQQQAQARAQAATTPQPTMTPRQQAAQLQQVSSQAHAQAQAAQAQIHQQQQAQQQQQQAQNAGQQGQAQQMQGQQQGQGQAAGQFAGMYGYPGFQVPMNSSASYFQQVNRNMLTPAQQAQLQQMQQQHIQNQQAQAQAQGQGQQQQQQQQVQGGQGGPSQTVVPQNIVQQMGILQAQINSVTASFNNILTTTGGHLDPQQQAMCQQLQGRREFMLKQLGMLKMQVQVANAAGQGGGAGQAQAQAQMLAQAASAGGGGGMGNMQMAGHGGVQTAQQQAQAAAMMKLASAQGQMMGAGQGYTQQQMALLMQKRLQQQHQQQQQQQAQAQALQQQQQKALAMKGVAGKKPGQR